MQQNNRVQGERWRPFLAWLRRYRPYVTATLAILVLLVLLVLLGYCVPDWPRQIAISRATYYEEGQILLAGLESDIEAVIAAARQDDELAGVTLEPITPTLELDFFQRLPLDCALRSRVIAPDDRYLISLYQIEGKVPEPKVVEVIQRRAESLGVDVSPELNYRTGRPPVPLKGDPWSVGGGPWSVGGGPWSVGGGPWSVGGGAMGDELVEEANDAFGKQWALNEQGINVQSITPKDPEAGRGVRVGIFDTLPLPVNVSSIVVSMDPPLTLNLVHYMIGGRLDPESNDPDIDDHGLFAAGLVHSVAPGSDIQLIRVLDDTAQGNVWILNAALNDFIDQVTRDRDELEGAVINLSLGIHPKPGADESNLPEKVRSLQTILESAECLDIVVVAAAGNASADSDTGLPMERPAVWDSTIGVAASNWDKQRSCFSNCGQVAAPGGEGKSKCLDKCVPAIDECVKAEKTPEGKPPPCQYAVISLALSSPSGYAYWAGTSFSTPLISGLAARIIGEAEDWTLSKDDVLAQMDYVPMIDRCVETGVIDAAGSLQ